MATVHVVKSGDSVTSLAEHYGLYELTIWNAPENAALRAARPDMNTLMPGDQLFIPERRMKPEHVMTDARHTFRRKGVPASFRLQLFDFGEPRANQAFTLIVDGETTIEGSADADGVVEVKLPPRSRTGELTIGEDEFVVQLMFGHLDPIDELSGVQQRLTNLGYDCGPANGTLGTKTREALRAFQLSQRPDLEVSGELDETTRARLAELHDDVSDQSSGASGE
ncbi:peptidoglycan-binding protein [Pseudenhygromyxa sp. WMMC2535]|uniref:peptidoglycan-binding protein n=1 Tax=Pseudenhygromyxa sp. WMMC2535 TaxID=2712867 RepID=UPI0015530F98|nr:peptidoglycan-binding protein [Pseudenhygromyxa sp. WMMC2535]